MEGEREFRLTHMVVCKTDQFGCLWLWSRERCVRTVAGCVICAAWCRKNSVSSEGVNSCCSVSQEASGLSQEGRNAMAGCCSHRLWGKCIVCDSGQNRKKIKNSK